jgi:hypothetical protein
LKLLSLLILFIAFLATGCVGTVQESAESYTGVNDAPKIPMDFTGIATATAISDTRIEVFFYPATGGSGKYTYDIIVGSAPYPISIPSDVLKPDYRGTLKYTITGLSRLTSYQVKVEVRDNATNIQSNSQQVRTATTFDNQVADFQGISSAYNMPGQDGKDSIKIRWTPAKTSGGLTKKDWDPKSYEVILVDSEKLTPNDMDVPYTNTDGRWVFSFIHDDTVNEYVVRGLPSETKFYVRMRAIHEASVDDVFNLKRRSELNTNYVLISTLSASLADITFPSDAFALALAPGPQGLNAIMASWKAATGVFDHYRLYYSLAGGGASSGVLPANCLSPLLSAPGETIFCKKVDFSTVGTPITGLNPYSNYEVVLVLCATSQCDVSERILSPVRTITTDPNIPAFNGVRGDPLEAQSLDDIGALYLLFDPPNFSLGYFDGLVLKMRRTLDGTDTEVEITSSSYPVSHENFNFLTENRVKVKGIDYLETDPYCFTLYPYKWDADGVTRKDMPNNIWKCAQPRAKSPTVIQFPGLKTGATEDDSVTLNWDTPSGGMFTHYELFWRKQSGAVFSWGDAVSQAGNSFNYTNYGRVLIDSDQTTITMAGFTDGEYYFGMLTYFTYVSNTGTVILRSETNGSFKKCKIDSTATDPITCI